MAEYTSNSVVMDPSSSISTTGGGIILDSASAVDNNSFYDFSSTKPPRGYEQSMIPTTEQQSVHKSPLESVLEQQVQLAKGILIKCICTVIILLHFCFCSST